MTGQSGPQGWADDWAGGPVGSQALCILAPNPGLMTLDGTNTWLIGADDSSTATLIDPGPAMPQHWAAITTALDQRNQRVDQIIVTHGHADHAESALPLAEHFGCSVRAWDPGRRWGPDGLVDGDIVECGGVELHVLVTPGHSADSASFAIPGAQFLLTGDTILGRGTTVVAHPEGRIADYLESLQRLQDYCVAHDIEQILPGHGPTLPNAPTVVEEYVKHRHARLEQVVEAVKSIDPAGSLDPTSSGGSKLVDRVVEVVYAQVPRALWPAARLSVQAQLHYLGYPVA